MSNPNPLLSPSLPPISISRPDGEPSSFADETFSEAEITAWEQLILLSESTGGVTDICSPAGSGSSSNRSINALTVLPLVEEEEDDDVAEDDEGFWRRMKRYQITAWEQLIQLSESTCGVTDISGSSSNRSINAPTVPRFVEEEDDDVAEDDEGLWRRKKKRYRLISDIYASTSQIAIASTGFNDKKKKRM